MKNSFVNASKSLKPKLAIVAAAAGILLGTVATAPALASAGSSSLCQAIFVGVGNTPAGIVATSGRIFPRGVPRTEGNHFQVSYESEYTFSEAGPLLRDYAPAANVVPRAQWNAMTDAQRVDWLKSRFQDRPEFATASGLRKIATDLPFMPEELVIDSTGNVEIIIDPPLNTIHEWRTTVNAIVARYGAGSQQAMLSKPREAAFTSGVRNPEVESQHLGWLVYTNLFDMFQKLESGEQRYRRDPTKLTALSFDHPFLGPMTRVKRDVMENFLRGNANLEFYDTESKRFVRKSDASFKYTSGPAYRPDIAGPVRWAWEIRNAHKDVEDLINKVHRDVIAHAMGLQSYRSFADVPAFDSVADYNKLPSNVKTLLETLFPSKADPRFNYEVDERLALETFRNFALPLMNTTNLVAALVNSPASRTALSTRIQTAQLAYVSNLQTVAHDLNTNAITQLQAKARVMGLLGTWSVSSGLTDAFQGRAREIGHDLEFPALQGQELRLAPSQGLRTAM